MMYGYPGGYGSGAGWLGMGLMMLFGLLFLIGLIVLIVWLVRNAGGAGHEQYGRRDNACDIARDRYARGEIGKEEYEDICRTLGRS